MKINYSGLLATALLLSGSTFMTEAQTILHVKANATGANNGTNWADAYTSLQSAITIARNTPATSYEIWVAGGMYKPTHDPSGSASPANTGDKTFYLVNGTKFYGGFAGTETLFSQRDLSLTANASILSGDLNNSNTINTGDAYHVVISVGATAITIFDGFTVTGGYSSLATPLTVAGQSLYRDAGAGMINSASSPAIANCTFSVNKSAGNGGGLFNANASAPTISNTAFSGNTANYGGGMYNISSSPNINNCTFTGDTATSWGGAMLNNDGSSPVISNTTFSGNTAANGGAILINGSTNYSITNCAISGNTASNTGGGVFLNTAQGKIINCTISGNMSSNMGGGLYYNNVAGGTIVNSIIYGNSTSNATDANRKEIYKDGLSGNVLTISYSIVKDYLSTATNDFTWGTGNSIDDPLFVNPQSADNAPTLSGDYRLWFCSAATNGGDPQTNDSGYPVQAGTTDLNNNPRIHDAAIDMGAYEKQGDLSNLSSYAALNSSNSNGIAFLPTCNDNDNWTWYAPANSPDSLSFAIKWGASNSVAQAAAAISLTVAANNVIASNGTNLAILAMKRSWNVDLDTNSLAEPVSVRFLYSTADTTAMRSDAAGLNIGSAHELTWFTTTGTQYNTNLISFNNINSGNYTTLTPVYGTANNVPYVQFDNLTSLNGGTAAIKVGSDNPSHIKDVAKDVLLNMYPNPANGSFTLTLKAGKSVPGTVKIYDAVGRVVYSHEVTTGNTTINTQLNSGIYLVLVHYDGKIYSNKLLVK